MNPADLPSEFLSTPFGQQLRPQIDQMFGRASNLPHASTSARIPPTASSLLSSVASQAYTPSNGTATPPQQSITSSTTSPLTFSTNLASFTSTLHSHALTFALFTSKSTIITYQVQQAFERIAQEEKRRRTGQQAGKGGDVAFVEVDVDMPTGMEVAKRYGVVDTPGYAFFKGEEKVRIRRRSFIGFVLTFWFQILQLGKTNSTELHEAIRKQIQEHVNRS